MVCLLCPWLVWLVCLWARNVLVSAWTCLCGFLYRDRPAERTCSLYVNMRPVCCTRSFILHVKISPDFPPVAIVSVSGKQGGSVSMCSVVISATLTNLQEGCCLMKQSFTSDCWSIGVKLSNSGIHKKAWKTWWCLQHLSNTESYNFMVWPVHAGVITIYSLLLIITCQPIS